MSILDIVKHAVKTIIFTLTNKDRLSIISFDSKAYSTFSLGKMSESGKKKALTALENLKPLDSTNIWAGLEEGLNSLRKIHGNGGVYRKKSVFLLTDGQPVNSPPGGEGTSLHKYFEIYPDFKCQVHTFGFGYCLNSELLVNISQEGNGVFSFIPDAKIVGTCFVNAMANACSNFSQSCKIHMELKNGATFSDQQLVPYTPTPWGHVVNIGPLQYGQYRDIVVKLNIPGLRNENPPQKRLKQVTKDETDYLIVTVVYEDLLGNSQEHRCAGSSHSATEHSRLAHVRNDIINTVTNVIKECQGARCPNGIKLMRDLSNRILTLNTEFPNNDTILGFLGDVNERMSKAISTAERFKRWGQHYLRSIISAHQLQIRTNFMDKGLQQYGGELFKNLQNQGGKIFITLPMKKRVDYSDSRPRVTPTPVATTTYYAGGGGGCFDGSCTVVIYNGVGIEKRIPITELQKNHFVQVKASDASAFDSFVCVQCVVKTQMNTSIDHTMVEFVESGLILSNKHPILWNGVWRYPIELINGNTIISRRETPKYVYNFIFGDDNSPKIMTVNGINCVTYGHGFKEIWHPFYASARVIKVVKEFAEYETGLVCVIGSLQSYEDRYD
jgi:hypothetical protein